MTVRAQRSAKEGGSWAGSRSMNGAEQVAQAGALWRRWWDWGFACGGSGQRV